MRPNRPSKWCLQSKSRNFQITLNYVQPSLQMLQSNHSLLSLQRTKRKTVYEKGLLPSNCMSQEQQHDWQRSHCELQWGEFAPSSSQCSSVWKRQILHQQSEEEEDFKRWVTEVIIAATFNEPSLYWGTGPEILRCHMCQNRLAFFSSRGASTFSLQLLSMIWMAPSSLLDSWRISLPRNTGISGQVGNRFS